MTEAISLKTKGLLRRSFLTPRNDGSKLWVFVQALINKMDRTYLMHGRPVASSGEASGHLFLIGVACKLYIIVQAPCQLIN